MDGITRRVLFGLGAAGVARAAIQGTVSNGPRCPHCGLVSDGPLGYIVTSQRGDAVLPQVAVQVQAHVCAGCGVMFATVAQS